MALKHGGVGPRSGRRFRLALPPALRYGQYRNFWLGMLAAVGGFQVLQFGQFWLVHQLTDSPLALGYVGLANAIPAISLNLVGGVIADRVEQRKLIVVTESLMACLVLVLATLTLLHVVRVWHVLVLAVFAGGINAFNQPARQAIYPRLVDRSVLMSAVALNSSVWQGMRIVAPAVAGVLIATINTAAAFYLTAAGGLTFAFIVSRLEAPPIEARARTHSVSDLTEGLSFIKGNPIFSFLIGMVFFNSFFGLGYLALMPVFAVDVLHVGAGGQSVLMSVSGVGSLVVTTYLGTRSNPKRKGAMLIGGAVMAGMSITAFALTSRFVGSFPLAIVLMVLIGTSTSMYMISVMSALQIMVPDRMRGRVMGFYGMTYNIMPLGGMFAGGIANVIGAPYAVAIGGAMVVVFAIGPALLNGKVRDLGQLVTAAETSASALARA